MRDFPGLHLGGPSFLVLLLSVRIAKEVAALMKREEIRRHCLARPGTTEERPFGPDTLVFKVMGKLFALTGDEPEPSSINLKCDPDDSLALQSEFEGVRPGYHMDKRHWITVTLHSDVPRSLLLELIDDSYALVVARLPRRARESLKHLRPPKA